MICWTSELERPGASDGQLEELRGRKYWAQHIGEGNKSLSNQNSCLEIRTSRQSCRRCRRRRRCRRAATGEDSDRRRPLS
jgi:hypothetical protein